ncbi:hypothetical protein NX059_010543 [Plenodomus lindquistii]|nr:hypothetical protein NX059_010543 [Plenodomus lindquistii]
MTDYAYERFDDARSQIRVLTLHPGTGDEQPSCTLKLFGLDALPSYDAISYTWGDATVKRPIQIDGKRFEVLGNAYDAVIELRYPESDRLIWIDAICIDQQGLEEKQHQILLMKIVYERASRVVVWLSEPHGDADLVVAMLHQLQTEVEEGNNTNAYTMRKHWLNIRTKSPNWIALTDFVFHPWWSRVWTFQEAVVGRILVFQLGTHLITWELVSSLGDLAPVIAPELYELFRQNKGSEHSREDAFRGTRFIRHVRHQLQNRDAPDLPTLLSYCRSRSSTHIRDRIYGVCALSSDAVELSIHPDYAKPLEDVLTDVMNNVLLHYKSFELFYIAGVGHLRKLATLPSYVPDWSTLPNVNDLWWRFREDSDLASPTISRISLNPDGRLQTRMFIVDHVETVSDAYAYPEGQSRDKPVWRRWSLSWDDKAERMAIDGTRDPYPRKFPPLPDVSRYEAFWRTLVANSSRDGSCAPEDWKDGYAEGRALTARSLGVKPTSLFADIDPSQEEYSYPDETMYAACLAWYDMMGSICGNRAFCTTHNGMMGLVPPLTQKGDIVCLLPGGVIPYLMRKKEPSVSGNEFQLVGESYFHGVSAVAGMNWLRETGVEPQSIVLVHMLCEIGLAKKRPTGGGGRIYVL